jgi:site-specific DNA recombinase
MNTVLTYIRVSTDEQALYGHSLRDQQDKIDKYCESKEYKIAYKFTDDHSAKSFDRPEFKKLIEYLKKNKGTVNKLVFLKWDRFSRNATEALIMIKKLKSYGVECEAIEQPLDLSLPENKLLLVIYLSTPEIENDRRSMNITSGIRRSLKDGRFCRTAPYGYKYSRDNSNRPVLVPNGIKAELIKESFELFSTGLYSKQEVRRMLMKKGMKLSKSGFPLIFDNIAYIGYIRIPAFKNEPEQIVKGIHQPLISEELFQRVQFVLGKKNSFLSKPKTAKEELPLRGFLICPLCKGNLTGSASRSRNGSRIFYYHCQSGCKHRVNAIHANNKFDEWLDEISLKPKHKKTCLKLIENIDKSNNSNRLNELKSVNSQIEKLNESLLKTDKLLVDGKIEMDSYLRLKDSFKEELVELQIRKTEINNLNENILSNMEFAFQVMENLRMLWKDLDLNGKSMLLGSIFPDKLIFENNQYRTSSENLIISEYFNSTNGFQENKNKKVVNFDDFTSCVVPAGIEPATQGFSVLCSTN